MSQRYFILAFLPVNCTPEELQGAIIRNLSNPNGVRILVSPITEGLVAIQADLEHVLDFQTKREIDNAASDSILEFQHFELSPVGLAAHYIICVKSNTELPGRNPLMDRLWSECYFVAKENGATFQDMKFRDGLVTFVFSSMTPFTPEAIAALKQKIVDEAGLKLAYEATVP